MTQKEEFDKAIEILDTIEENINICCAVTMEPDEVLELIDKLRTIIKNGENNENEANGRSSTP